MLTQLGVTFYEQHKYEDALSSFSHRETSWTIAPSRFGTTLAHWTRLENTLEAIEIFTWLLQSNKSPDDDPCWESKEWTDGLKTDCVYRLGVCFKHLGQEAGSRALLSPVC